MHQPFDVFPFRVLRQTLSFSVRTVWSLTVRTFQTTWSDSDMMPGYCAQCALLCLPHHHVDVPWPLLRLDMRSNLPHPGEILILHILSDFCSVVSAAHASTVMICYFAEGWSIIAWVHRTSTRSSNRVCQSQTPSGMVLEMGSIGIEYEMRNRVTCVFCPASIFEKYSK